MKPVACVVSAWLVASLFCAADVRALTLPDTMAQRLQACTACHGKQGRAAPDGYYPRIAGKPAGYLFNQLVAFRDGRRANRTMAQLLAQMDDAYLQQIADHFALLELPYAPPGAVAASARDLELGQTLVRHGDEARHVPACMRCHGTAMTGVVPSIPGLLGLPRDYLSAQLGAWRSGARRAASPDCMAQIAQALNEEQIGALASWLASQPLPADTRPAPSIVLPLPLDCGSAWR